MFTIAIDPGASGAIACAHKDDVWVDSMPETLGDLLEYLVTTTQNPYYFPVLCKMEKVGAMPTDGKASLWKFAKHVGHLEAGLSAYGIPCEEVAPSTWQRALGAMPKDKTQRKRHIKDLMQRRYPSLKVTLKNADALGILTWALGR